MNDPSAVFGKPHLSAPKPPAAAAPDQGEQQPPLQHAATTDSSKSAGFAADLADTANTDGHAGGEDCRRSLQLHAYIHSIFAHSCVLQLILRHVLPGFADAGPALASAGSFATPFDNGGSGEHAKAVAEPSGWEAF